MKKAAPVTLDIELLRQGIAVFFVKFHVAQQARLLPRAFAYRAKNPPACAEGFEVTRRGWMLGSYYRFGCCLVDKGWSAEHVAFSYVQIVV